MSEQGTPDLGELGVRRVDAPIHCVITRMGLRSPRFLPGAVRDYRRLLKVMDDPRALGLLQTAFLVENPSTCYSLSIWSGEPYFSGQVEEHVDVVRRTFGRLAFDRATGPELWSTTWRLTKTSNNVNWPGLDLVGAIEEAG
jgi:hypothetical protein